MDRLIVEDAAQGIVCTEPVPVTTDWPGPELCTYWKPPVPVKYTIAHIYSSFINIFQYILLNDLLSGFIIIHSL